MCWAFTWWEREVSVAALYTKDRVRTRSSLGRIAWSGKSYPVDGDVDLRRCKGLLALLTMVEEARKRTLEDAQGVLVVGEVPQAADVGAALEARDVEALFQQVLDGDEAHGACTCKRSVRTIHREFLQRRFTYRGQQQQPSAVPPLLTSSYRERIMMLPPQKKNGIFKGSI